MTASRFSSDDIESVLYHETTILSRLDEMAAEITEKYEGKELLVVCILHGGIIFMADLLRRIQLPLRMETISVSSYHGGTASSGQVSFDHFPLGDLKGQHVLLLDDILDTGRTLHEIGARIEAECSPESVRSCVLLDKKAPRAEEVEGDFVGFEIEDQFVVGYGLDYQARYRNLPYIGILKPECYLD